MAFMELKNIGKIYVSDNNVSVGIRGINLNFDIGEFVVVTGSSGSGKTTLLNVISGMDSYEEGEMTINGNPTSHYIQPDWEKYRKQYVSFVFQDYNIIESFTVLQNVEFALTDIADIKERRKKALELLDRVGMSKFIHHKGSKLSGGQKQRTVIARALAKDSPIILADEPTGNLDSKSSAEIVALLKEISKNKLVVVVTHNYEQFEDAATRHILLKDGAVVMNQVLVDCEAINPNELTQKSTSVTKHAKTDFADAIRLGLARNAAKPKLTAFICFLLIISFVMMAVVTAVRLASEEKRADINLIQHYDGRVIIARPDGHALTEKEVAEVMSATEGKSYIRYDYALDSQEYACLEYKAGYNEEEKREIWEQLEYKQQYAMPGEMPSSLDAGRYPQAINEVVLALPIEYEKIFGSEKQLYPIIYYFTDQGVLAGSDPCYVVGIKYFYDNTKAAVLYCTEETFDYITAMTYASQCLLLDFEFSLKDGNGIDLISSDATNRVVSVDVTQPQGTYFISVYRDVFDRKASPYDFDNESRIIRYDNPATVIVDMSRRSMTTPAPTLSDKAEEAFSHYYSNHYDSIHQTTLGNVEPVDIVGKYKYGGCAYHETPSLSPETVGFSYLHISPDIYVDIVMNEYLPTASKQASIMYDNDKEAVKAVPKLRELGYNVLASCETRKEQQAERTAVVMNVAGSLLCWGVCVVFVTLLMVLCTSKSLNITKNDLAVMRSMGIRTNVIRISTYLFLCNSLLPACLISGIILTVFYMLPTTNPLLPFLHAGDYLAIFLMLVAVLALLARWTTRRIFNQSVKKVLRGGNSHE